MSGRAHTMVFLLGGALLLVVAWLLFPRGEGTAPEFDRPGPSPAESVERGAERGGDPHRAEVSSAVGPASSSPEVRLPAAGRRVVASGLVLAASTREPVAGATVRDLHGVTATSDAAGFFELTTVVEGRRAVLLAHADGFLRGTAEIWSHRITAGRSEQEFLLLPASAGAVVRGAIAGEGRPVADAEVRLAHRVLDDGPQVLPETRSAADGSFELSGVRPGRYVLQVFAPSFDDYVRSELELPTGVTDLGTITLTTYPWATLEGTVTDAAGDVVPNVQVSVRQQGRHGNTTRTDATGRYVFERVDPGRRSIRFAQDVGHSVGRTVALQAGEVHVEDVVLPGGGHFIGGRVTVGGVPAVDFEVSCDLSAGFAEFDYVALSRRVAADGSFRLDGLPPGRVDLRFSKDRPYSSHSTEGLELDRDDYVFDFPSSERAVTVRGTVRDVEGGPLAGARVSPWHPSGPEEQATTDHLGGYSLRTTMTFDSTFPIQAERPGFVTEVGFLTRSRVDDRGVAQLDLTLRRESPAPPLTGLVADVSGRPVARVFCVCRAPDRDTAIAYSDSLGRFRFDGISPGEVQLTFRHPDYTEARVGHRHGWTSGEPRATLNSLTRRERRLVVLGSGGIPLVKAEVNAWVRGAYVTSGFTDATGGVTLSGLPEGEIEFSVEVPGHPRTELRHVIRGKLPAPLTFRLAAGPLSIAGKVVDATGDPRPGVELGLRSKMANASVSVYAIVISDEAGEFGFEDLPDGVYTLEALSQAGKAEVDVRAGESGVVVRLR